MTTTDTTAAAGTTSEQIRDARVLIVGAGVSGMTAAMVMLLPEAMALAMAFGRYPSSSAAWRTRSLASWLAEPREARTRAAVDLDTPAALAMSTTVTE